MRARIQTYEPEVATLTDVRRFVLQWNLSKEPGAGPDRHRWRSVAGVKFGDGRVVLANGTTFAMQGELEDTLAQFGRYRIDWIDKEVQSCLQ